MPPTVKTRLLSRWVYLVAGGRCRASDRWAAARGQSSSMRLYYGSRHAFATAYNPAVPAACGRWVLSWWADHSTNIHWHAKPRTHLLLVATQLCVRRTSANAGAVPSCWPRCRRRLRHRPGGCPRVLALVAKWWNTWAGSDRAGCNGMLGMGAAWSPYACRQLPRHSNPQQPACCATHPCRRSAVGWLSRTGRSP